LVLLIAAIARPAAAEVGPRIEYDAVSIRLVASARQDGAPPVAALEMQLAPGWKAYWRTPGEGGLPTTFDFSLSRNVAAAEVFYPAPRRYTDAWSVTNVYEGRVIFPIEVTPGVGTAPLTVHVRIDMGICETICIPLQVEAAVTFAPNDVDAAALALFDEGTALLPTPPVAGEFEVTDLALITKNGTESIFELVATVPQAFGTELFVEGPEGWWPTVPEQTGRDGNRLTFRFSFVRPDAAESLTGALITVTLVSAGTAIEQQIVLP
jgi:DsbC/DsbD-like thiol-disulfide interchange protein